MLVDANDPWMVLVCPLGNIQIFAVNLSQYTYKTTQYALLDPQEQLRANLLLEPAKINFIQTRVWLRTILGQLLGTAPEHVPLQTDAQGKPQLACDSFHINWSHSRDACVLAVSRTALVGIDIEFHRERYSLEIAERFFHPNEFVQIKGMLEADARVAFFRYWSRKEAHYKCVGGTFMGGSLATDLRSHQIGNVFLWDFQGPFPNQAHSLGLAAHIR